MIYRYPKIAIHIFFILNIFQGSAQTVFINEISICNISKELDPDYDYSAWIELYNASEIDIDLNDLYYSDEQGKPKKFSLTKSRILPRKGYASIWINDEISDGGLYYLDTDPDGGYLSVSDVNGNILDAITYPSQKTNVSWGRTSDGGMNFGYFVSSTHDKSNDNSETASFVVSEPTFSIKGGFYSSPVSVLIDCITEDAKIYYTLDGSDPSPKKNLYSGTPIMIDSSMPLRAKAYAVGYLEGTISTTTYIINERIPNLPAVFITTDTVNLYNDTIGIYCIGTNGTKVHNSEIIANYAQDWTRPAHLEYLNENKSLCLNQAIGLEISGNASRKYDQKSFNIKAGKKYGKNRMDYQFFTSKEGRRYKSLLLRNGGQNYNRGAFQDLFVQSQSSILGLDYQSSQTSAVYINGKYWGMLNIQERSNEDYLYSNYGWKNTEIDIIDNFSKPFCNMQI